MNGPILLSTLIITNDILDLTLLSVWTRGTGAMNPYRAQQCMVLFRDRTYEEAFENTLKVFNDHELDITECNLDKGTITGNIPINPPYENLRLSAQLFRGNTTTLVGVKGKMDAPTDEDRKLAKWIRKFYFDLKDLTEGE